MINSLCLTAAAASRLSFGDLGAHDTTYGFHKPLYRPVWSAKHQEWTDTAPPPTTSVAQLERENEELKARIAELERRVGILATKVVFGE